VFFFNVEQSIALLTTTQHHHCRMCHQHPEYI